MKLTRYLAAAGISALAASLAAPAFAGEVSGVVVDASDTISLQAAEVRLVELNRVAIAERDGSFYFPDVPAGTYTLVANYVGAKPVTQTVTVPETGTVRSNFLLGGAGSEILVLGQSANQASALSRKRASDVVSDVLTRDAIGQFPDQNVAESLRRLPGVNVLNDQGEGRFVSVRGLDPDLNSTSLNGVRLPAPESDVRSVALDVISSDIIESIEVKKSLTPDMDADTIGASIEIKTTSAFDRKKDLLTAKVEGSYNDYADALTPKASVDFATRVTDNFGIAGGISYYNRKFETDNIEADGWEDAGSGPFATDLEYRDYDVERERISATLGLDARLGEHSELYLKGVWSQFDDQEYRRRLIFDLGDFDGGASSQDGANVTFSDADEEFTVERDLKDRFERQRIRSVVLGGESRFDGWLAEYAISYAKSTERENGSLDPVSFERDFDGDGLIVGFDYSNPRIPRYSVSGDTADFFDPAEFELNDVEFTTLSDSQDTEYAAQFDLGREIAMDGGTFTVQAGAKGRWREKSYNKQVEFYETDDFLLSDVLGTQTYRLTDISPVADKTSPRDFFLTNFGDFELQAADSIFDSAVEDYSIQEDILASYLLGKWESTSLRVIGGVRYEKTSNDIVGNTVTLFEEDSTLPNGDTAGEDTVVISQSFFTKEYDDWLPSLNIRWEAQPDLIVRVAGYRSLVRPRLSRLAPRFAVEQNDDNERQGEFGNPALEPFKAWNFDASAEYYMSTNGAITAAFFYKDIKDFIIDANIDTPGTFAGIEFDEATIPINGPSGEIYGFEFGFAQTFSHLQGPLRGLILQANYTYTNATGLVADGDFADIDSVDTFREITLPASSRHTFNAVIGYDAGPIDLRLAGTYRDKYLDELGSDAEADRFVTDHFQLDFSAKYRINDMAQVYVEVINITDAEYFAYNTLGGQENLYQFERYGQTVKFGARVNF